MSLINKKLKQIGRRFSVNGIEVNMSHQHLPSATTTTSSSSPPSSSSTNMSQSYKFSPDQPDYTGTCSGRENQQCYQYGIDDSYNVESSTPPSIFNETKLETEYGNGCDYDQWYQAMRMVARLPAGIPSSFRKKLWLTLADRYIQSRPEINWEETCEKCFNQTINNPDDEQLGIQIVKDLHRTGCSMFTSEQQHNQLLLKQVLLAYARFNQSVGYCQGFNMLAAILLEVLEGNVSHALKVMIYLIEHLLPEGYYTNNLRGLSVDMVVFRDLMRLKLPILAAHLDRLQNDSYDRQLGIHYEPPLINAFTMQWFLTLFSNCLPKQTVLRIWDLIFLEGNEILLRTALVIWDCLADRIMAVKSADEFYSIMDVLTREIIEFGPTDTNEFINTICNMAPFPFPRLMELRDNYYYNISPFNQTMNQCKIQGGFMQMFSQSVHKFFEDDFGQQNNNDCLFLKQSNSSSSSDGSFCQQPKSNINQTGSWFDDQTIMINWFLNQTGNNISGQTRRSSPNRSPIHSISESGTNFIESIMKQIQGGPAVGPSPGPCSSSSGQSANGTGRESLSVNNNKLGLDVSLLKKQYIKLKQRQQQVQIILKEGFQYNSAQQQFQDPGSEMNNNNNSQQDNRNRAGFSMAGLLRGKTPLLTQNRILNANNDSAGSKLMINQLITRDQTFNRAHVYSGARTISPLAVRRSSSYNVTTSTTSAAATAIDRPTFQVIALQPQTKSQLKQSYQNDTNQTTNGTGSIIASLPVPQQLNPTQGQSTTNHRSITPHSPIPRLSKRSSGSSTSTELCDEIMGLLSSANSSIDDHDDEHDDDEEVWALEPSPQMVIAYNEHGTRPHHHQAICTLKSPLKNDQKSPAQHRSSLPIKRSLARMNGRVLSSSSSSSNSSTSGSITNDGDPNSDPSDPTTATNTTSNTFRGDSSGSVSGAGLDDPFKIAYSTSSTNNNATYMNGLDDHNEYNDDIFGDEELNESKTMCSVQYCNDNQAEVMLHHNQELKTNVNVVYNLEDDWNDYQNTNTLLNQAIRRFQEQISQVKID